MYTSETRVRVRYAETDQMGYVYYGNYATYYEVARVECIRSLGFTYKALEEMGVMMPVLELHTFYYQPARYDELLTIKVSIPKLPTLKILFLYEIFNEEGKLLNKGETTLVFINMQTNKPVRMPEVMGKLLERYFK